MFKHSLRTFENIHFQPKNLDILTNSDVYIYAKDEISSRAFSNYNQYFFIYFIVYIVSHQKNIV